MMDPPAHVREKKRLLREDRAAVEQMQSLFSMPEPTEA